jgi:MFS family permease
MMTSFLGWRSVLFVNVPIGLVGAYISWQALGPIVEQRDEQRKKPSQTPILGSIYKGAIAVTSGLILLVYVLTRAASSSFRQTGTWLPLILSAAVFALFFFIERRAKNPLVPPAFIKKPIQLSAILGGLLAPAGYSEMILIIVTYLQEVMNYTPLFTQIRVCSSRDKVCLEFAILYFTLIPQDRSKVYSRVRNGHDDSGFPIAI